VTFGLFLVVSFSDSGSDSWLWMESAEMDVRLRFGAGDGFGALRVVVALGFSQVLREFSFDIVGRG
jgi:hypothetical protein